MVDTRRRIHESEISKFPPTTKRVPRGGQKFPGTHIEGNLIEIIIKN